jgi:hypothetical protein
MLRVVLIPDFLLPAILLAIQASLAFIIWQMWHMLCLENFEQGYIFLF